MGSLRICACGLYGGKDRLRCNDILRRLEGSSGSDHHGGRPHPGGGYRQQPYPGIRCVLQSPADDHRIPAEWSAHGSHRPHRFACGCGRQALCGHVQRRPGRDRRPADPGNHAGDREPGACPAGQRLQVRARQDRRGQRRPHLHPQHRLLLRPASVLPTGRVHGLLRQQQGGCDGGGHLPVLLEVHHDRRAACQHDQHSASGVFQPPLRA